MTRDPTKFTKGAVLGVLTTISGEVLIRTAEGELKSGALGTTLSDGDTVITGRDGTAIIEMEGAAIRLESSTHLVIEDWTKRFFELLKGKIRVFIKGFRPMQVETPTAVMAVRGTEFTINVDEDGTTTVAVLEGIVEVRDLASNSIVLLEPFQMNTVPKIPGGFEQQDMLGRVTRADPELIERWWEEGLPTTREPPVVWNPIMIDSPFGLNMPSPGIYTYETNQASLKLHGRVQGVTSLSRLTVANIEVPAVPVGEGVYIFNVDLPLAEGKNRVEIRAEYEDGSVVTGVFEVLRSGPTVSPSVPTVGGAPFTVGIIGIVVLICIVVIPIVAVKRRRSRRRKSKEKSEEWLETLKLRLAKGEITKEGYAELKKKLKET